MDQIFTNSDMEFEKELEERINDRIKDRIEKYEQRLKKEFNPEILLWLSFVSDWTVELVKNSGIPIKEDEDSQSFLERVKDMGLCKYKPETNYFDFDSQEIIVEPALYSILSEKSRDIMNKIGENSGKEGGNKYIINIMFNVGVALLRIKDKKLIPPIKIKWAELAKRSKNSNRLIKYLEIKVGDALKQSDYENAKEWVNIASIIDQYSFWTSKFSQTLFEKIKTFNRKIDLKQRMWDEKKHLDFFLERKDQINAFHQLVHGNHKQWALHYIGVGGVGKTMLMRYIYTQLTKTTWERIEIFSILKEIQMHLAQIVQRETTAFSFMRDVYTQLKWRFLSGSSVRIDFDYINPDFPTKAPGLLLIKLAEGLRLFDETGKATSLFYKFYNDIAQYHEKITDIPMNLTQEYQDKEFISMVKSFAEAAKQLPQPIIILIDTCEELEKIQLEEKLPENIKKTFDILEIIHECIPAMRVVLCGRRPLATEGYNWKAINKTKDIKKEYLRLHEIRGFTEEEAKKYLIEKTCTDKILITTIINNSEEKGYIKRFNIEPENSFGTSEKVNHYNPYELNFFAKWVRADKKLTAEKLKGDEWYEYIEMRIIKRIRHRVLREILPAVIILGHFDKSILENTASEIINKNNYCSKFNELYVELEHQEWIDKKSDGTIEIERYIRQKLLNYYQKKHKQELLKYETSAREYLQKYILKEPFNDKKLEIYHFELLINLLCNEPELAIDWWRKIENKIQQENAFDWAFNMIQKLPMTFNVQIQAQISATLAAIHYRFGNVLEANRIWEAIRKKDEEIYNEGLKNELLIRSLSGLITSSQSTSLDECELKKILEILKKNNIVKLNENTIAAIICAIETLIQKAERQPQLFRQYISGMKMMSEEASVFHLNHFADAIQDRNKYLQAFVYIQIGRVWKILGGFSKMEDNFSKSLALMRDFDYDERNIWLDWNSSDNIPARVLLEIISALYPSMENPKNVLSKILPYIKGKFLRIMDLDSDRLNSAILQLKLATKAPEEYDINKRLINDSYGINFTTKGKLGNAHLCFKPLFFSILEAMISKGEIVEAVDIIRKKFVYSQQRYNMAIQEWNNELYLVTLRKMRLIDAGYEFNKQTNTSKVEEMLIWSIKAFGPPPKESPVKDMANIMDFGWIHARWRTLFTHDSNLAESALNWVIHWSLNIIDVSDLSFEGLSCMLDCLEAKLINEYEKIGFSLPEFDCSCVMKWVEKNLLEIDKSLQLMIRYNALKSSNQELNNDHIEKLAELIGLRRAAEIAIDEGELLTLRLPKEANTILHKAVDWFIKAEDFIGAILAQGCISLSRARINDRETMINALADLRNIYNQLLERNRALNLPDWQWIEEFVENPDKDNYYKSVNEAWRAWLIRFAACIAKIKDDKEVESHQIRCSNLQYLVREISNHNSDEQISSELLACLKVENSEEINYNSARYIPKDIVIGDIDNYEEPIVIEIRFKKANQQSMLFQSNYVVHLFLINKLTNEKIIESKCIIQNENNVRQYKIHIYDTNIIMILNRYISNNIDKFKKEYLDIELRIDSEVSWICWEGIFTENVIKKNYWDKLGFHRVDIDRPIRLWKESGYDIRVVYSITRIEEISNILERYLNRTKIDFKNFYNIDEILSGKSNISSLSNKEGLYIVGTPIMTHYGPRMRLGEYHSRYADDREISMSAYEQENLKEYEQERYDNLNKEMGLRKGTLLSMANIYSKKIFKSPLLCILQATPSFSSSITQNEQEESAYLHMMGADLSANKIPLVIVIPPLPWSIAEQIIRNLIDVMASIRSGEYGVLELFGRAIVKARKSIIIHNKDLTESAYNIGFYIAEWQSMTRHL